jgi:hypothetical protein
MPLEFLRREIGKTTNNLPRLNNSSNTPKFGPEQKPEQKPKQKPEQKPAINPEIEDFIKRATTVEQLQSSPYGYERRPEFMSMEDMLSKEREEELKRTQDEQIKEATEEMIRETGDTETADEIKKMGTDVFNQLLKETPRYPEGEISQMEEGLVEETPIKDWFRETFGKLEKRDLPQYMVDPETGKTTKFETAPTRSVRLPFTKPESSIHLHPDQLPAQIVGNLATVTIEAVPRAVLETLQMGRQAAAITQVEDSEGFFDRVKKGIEEAGEMTTPFDARILGYEGKDVDGMFKKALETAQERLEEEIFDKDGNYIPSDESDNWRIATKVYPAVAADIAHTVFDYWMTGPLLKTAPKSILKITKYNPQTEAALRTLNLDKTRIITKKTIEEAQRKGIMEKLTGDKLEQYLTIEELLNAGRNAMKGVTTPNEFMRVNSSLNYLLNRAGIRIDKVLTPKNLIDPKKGSITTQQQEIYKSLVENQLKPVSNFVKRIQDLSEKMLGIKYEAPILPKTPGQKALEEGVRRTTPETGAFVPEEFIPEATLKRIRALSAKGQTPEAIANKLKMDKALVDQVIAQTTMREKLRLSDRTETYEVRDHDKELARTLRGTKGMTADDIMKKYPDIRLEREVISKDVHGQKQTIPEGEILTPYELKDGKILLQDGETYLVNKNQFSNIKGHSISKEVSGFAPELEGLEETVKGVSKWQGDELYDNGNRIADIYEENGKWHYRSDFVEESPAFKTRKEAMENAEADTLGLYSGNETKYSQYQLPGGEYYREILIRAPKRAEYMGYQIKRIADKYQIYNSKEETTQGNLYNTRKEAEEALKRLLKFDDIDYQAPFKSPHWDEPNVIAHLRLNERKYKDKDVLFLEELQSDWAKEAREKRYDKPFKVEMDKWGDSWRIIDKDGKPMSFYYNGERIEGHTDKNVVESVAQKMTAEQPYHLILKKWQELSIKRALQEAVKTNADYFAWINGEQTSARYNLATYIDSVSWKGSEQNRVVSINPTDNGQTIQFQVREDGTIYTAGIGVPENWTGKRIDEVLGKGLADKIMEKPQGELSGEGLQFGGEWAKNLYDKQVANIVKDLTGATPQEIDMGLPIEKAEEQTFDISTETITQQGIELTPEVKARIKGEDLDFQASGKMFEPERYDDTKPDIFRVMEKDPFRQATVGTDIPIKDVIKKTTEVPASDFVKRRETTLLKERLKNYARGVREGRIDIRTSAEDALKQYENILKESGLSAHDRAKFMANMRNIATSTNPLEKFKNEFPGIQDRIGKLLEAEDVREIKKLIKKELKTPLTEVDKSGVKKGRTTIEVQKALAQIKSDLMLTQEQAKKEIENILQREVEGIKPDDVGINRLRVLKASAGDADSLAWRDLLEDIQTLKREGLTKYELDKFNKMAEEERIRQHWTTSVAPKGLLPGTDMAPSTLPGDMNTVIDRALRGLGSLEDHALTTQHLLDKIERGNVRIGELYLKGPITMHYTRGVTKASNRRYESRKALNNTANKMWGELWGLKPGTRKYRKAMRDHLTNKINLGKFVDQNKNVFDLEMTKDQLMYHWGQMQNPSILPTYIETIGWTDDIILAVNLSLSNKEKEFVRSVGGQGGFFEKSRTGEIDGIAMNPIYERMYGTRLGKVEGMYIPLERDIDMPSHVQMIQDFVQMNSTKITSIKGRVANKQPIRMDAGLMKSMNKYIIETSHWKTHAEFIEEFRRLFSGDVRKAVRQNFRDSETLLKEVDRQMNHLAADGINDARSFEMIDNLMASAYTGFIGANPSSALKQIVSIQAWLGEMSTRAFFEGSASFWLQSRNATEFLFEHSAGLRERADQATWEREAMRAIKSGDAHMLASRNINFSKNVMVLTSHTDMLAIVPGFWAKYLYELRILTKVKPPQRVEKLREFIKEHPEAHEEAMFLAQETYERTQQTGLMGKISSIRRGGSWAKMWTFAMSAPEAQFNQVISTLRAMGFFGDPKRIPTGKGLKRLLIYLVGIPALLQYISDGAEFRPYRQMVAVGTSTLTLGVSNYPVFFGSLLQNATRVAVGLPAFDTTTPAPISILRDLAKIPEGVLKLALQDITLEEIIETLAESGEIILTARGVPVQPVKRIVGGIVTYNEHEDFRRIMAFSEFALGEQGVEARPNRDPFGEPIGVLQKISIDKMLKGKDDPVTNELERLEVKATYPTRNIAGYTLSDEEYDLYLQDVGPRTYNNLLEQIQTPYYRDYNDAIKKEVIKDVYSNTRQESRGILFNHYYQAQSEIRSRVMQGEDEETAREAVEAEFNINTEASEKKLRKLVEQRKIEISPIYKSD